MITNKYKCTQDELYEILRLMWRSCRDNVAQFALYKAFYVLIYVNAKLAEIDAAEALPDDQQRALVPESTRISLVTKTNVALKKVRGLRGYIEKAFEASDELIKVNLEAAGFLDYEAAYAYNWDKVRSLLINATKYSTDHSAELTAGSNMPVAFPASMAVDRDLINPIITDYLNQKENTTEGQQTKVIANNAIYDKGLVMGSDGQFVFEDDDAKRVQFIFAQVKDVVSPPSQTGVNVNAKEDGTDVILEAVEVTVKKDGEAAIVKLSDITGRASFLGLTAGHYTVTLKLAGYVDIVDSFDLVVGVTSFKKYKMVKI